MKTHVEIRLDEIAGYLKQLVEMNKPCCLDDLPNLCKGEHLTKQQVDQAIEINEKLANLNPFNLPVEIPRKPKAKAKGAK